jgi:hypothetical protein
MREGSHDHPVRPKGAPPRRQTFSVDRGFIRGDRMTTTEDAIWLNPRYRTETLKDIIAHLGR